IEIDDLVRDPDAPRGSPPVLEFAGSVDGPGPISVTAGEAVLPTIRFTAPFFAPQDMFSATAVIGAPTWSKAVEIPVSAAIAGVRVAAGAPDISITQGGRAVAHLSVSSLGGPDTQISFFMVAAPQGIVLDPGTQAFPLPRGSSISVDLTFTARADASLGSHDLQGLEYSAF